MWLGLGLNRIAIHTCAAQDKGITPNAAVNVRSLPDRKKSYLVDIWPHIFADRTEIFIILSHTYWDFSITTDCTAD